MAVSYFKRMCMMFALSISLASTPSKAMLIHSETGFFDVWYESIDGHLGPQALPYPINVTTNAWSGFFYQLDVIHNDTFFFDLTIADQDNAFGQLYQPTIWGWRVPESGGGNLESLLADGPNYWLDLEPGTYWFRGFLMPTSEIWDGGWGTLYDAPLSTFVPSSEKVGYSFTVNAPEPESLLLMMAGLIGLIARIRSASAIRTVLVN